MDCSRLRRLEQRLRDQGNWEQLDRLRELRHPEVSHRWLWHLDSVKGSVLSQCDYVFNVQQRLGARIFEAEISCGICGVPLHPDLEHSEVCAIAEATKGHYACVRAAVDGLKMADPGVQTETRGLTNTQARPADIYTIAAVPGRRAALDVCIASPNAVAARGDAAEAAFKRKLDHYAAILPQLHQAGIAFRPLVWTADGRPHLAVTRSLRFAVERVAQKGSGTASCKEILGRWQHEIAVAIARRRAAMARAVLPQRSAHEQWLVSGRVEDGPCCVKRRPVLEEEPLEEELHGGRSG